MLTTELTSYFGKRTRAAGDEYFRLGYVHGLTIGGGRIWAAVHGTEDYAVEVDVEVDKDWWDLTAMCTCPMGNRAEPCKHLWAVLLEAEKKGLGALGPPPSDVTLEVLYSDDEPMVLVPPVVGRIGKVSTVDLARELAARGEGGPGRSGLGSGLSGWRIARQTQPKAPTKPEWVKRLESVSTGHSPAPDAERGAVTPLYVLDLEDSRVRGTPILLTKKAAPAGGKGKPKELKLLRSVLARMERAEDREICAMILGTARDDGYSYSYGYESSEDSSGRSARWRVSGAMLEELLPRMSRTGRLYGRDGRDAALVPLGMDEGGEWELALAVTPAQKNGSNTLSLVVRRGDERRPVSEFGLLIDGEPGWCVRGGVVARLRSHGCSNWVSASRDFAPVRVRTDELPRLAVELGRKGVFPPLELPAGCGVEEAGVSPVGRLLLREERREVMSPATVSADVEFQYGDRGVPQESTQRCLVSADGARIVRREAAAEGALLARLEELGARRSSYASWYSIRMNRFAGLVGTLLEEGWIVLGGKNLYRSPGAVNVSVASGIDWFELGGKVQFGDQEARLPELLAAVKKGEQFVRLGDGSLGMLPEKWLQRHGSWLALGEVEKGTVRFAKTQIGLIDALLAEMPEATCDAQISAARQRLRTFEGIRALPEPVGFEGRLREYQREGLGWLRFLGEFGFGGCLADDMGLGKTVQLLAHILEWRGQGNGAAGPWLVAAPKSLVFNWEREAGRFAPSLRVVRYTGTERAKIRDAMAGTDLVLTTYGTLRKDIEHLRQVEFAGVVLDEAQAIKNAGSLNAKAARLLRGRRRIAMTGTPVENHLGDLWSIFEFLNPGMLGSTAAFKAAFGAGGEENGKASLPLLARAVRPFILRRTKEKVAPELPARTEKTIGCELGPKQRALYDELRDHYRRSLLERVERSGLARNKIHVLEALLRLRQAACHPGLIDEAKRGMESAKLDSLVAMVEEMIEGGHKGLVFSQFTSMLSIVRGALAERGVVHEYLDGSTPERARAKAVDRFQGDKDCPLFLISLKAGGFGLNLTAADYVFILDPWWNPAVEAQAIDRAHRIGQEKKVIAYRLIAKETVESRILELQESKRALAEAIVGEQESVIRSLTREDLAALLS